jgi:hypothetical protein
MVEGRLRGDRMDGFGWMLGSSLVMRNVGFF